MDKCANASDHLLRGSLPLGKGKIMGWDGLMREVRTHPEMLSQRNGMGVGGEGDGVTLATR